MIFYIDADNKYKSRIDGIKSLSEKDTVYIYYNGNNNAFNNTSAPEFRKRRQCRCNIEFVRVENEPQAVDFAIAMDVATTISENKEEELIIIGEDKHFEVVRKLLNSDLVSYTSSIRNVLDKKFKSIDDIMEYINFVKLSFSPDIANKLIRNQIKMSIQLNKYATEIYRMMENELI